MTSEHGDLVAVVIFHFAASDVERVAHMLLAAVLGALLIGLIQGLNDGLPIAFGQQWSQSVVFTILIVILVFKPAGLLGKATTEKV